MPELPEVEVTRLGVDPHISGKTVTAVIMRRAGLRWPFPPDLPDLLKTKAVLRTGRRGKYLLLYFASGTLLIHLGMSGHLRVVPAGSPAEKHDHLDLVFGEQAIRMTDPRRFGAVLWHDATDPLPLAEHPLLKKLGVEPLEENFNGELLYQATRQRKSAIKQVLLAGDIVVGVGNIYACESLFKAGIHPEKPAHKVNRKSYHLLAQAIRETLAAAIQQGGSTLKDFIGVDGQSGYFQQSYFVYDREAQPCRICAHPVQRIVQGQRSSFFCKHCQK